MTTSGALYSAWYASSFIIYAYAVRYGCFATSLIFDKHLLNVPKVWRIQILRVNEGYRTSAKDGGRHNILNTPSKIILTHAWLPALLADLVSANIEAPSPHAPL